MQNLIMQIYQKKWTEIRCFLKMECPDDYFLAVFSNPVISIR